MWVYEKDIDIFFEHQTTHHVHPQKPPNFSVVLSSPLCVAGEKKKKNFEDNVKALFPFGIDSSSLFYFLSHGRKIFTSRRSRRPTALFSIAQASSKGARYIYLYMCVGVSFFLLFFGLHIPRNGAPSIARSLSLLPFSSLAPLPLPPFLHAILLSKPAAVYVHSYLCYVCVYMRVYIFIYIWSWWWCA